MFARRLDWRFSQINCKNEYLVFALKKETAVQAVVGSIVWALRRFETNKSEDAYNLPLPSNVKRELEFDDS